MSGMLDYLIVGAGPVGIACAREATLRGRTSLMLDKGAMLNALHFFPSEVTFFSTPDLLQLGADHFICDSFRPTRRQVIRYFLAIVRQYKLQAALWRTVTAIRREEDAFAVEAESSAGLEQYRAKRVIIATGYYDNPNPLNIPGEDLPKLTHYFTDAFPYYGARVAVVGGRNSAAEAAIALHRAGASVTLIHRGPALDGQVKPWVRPDIDKYIAGGKIRALFNARLAAVEPTAIRIAAPEGELSVENDFVFALTGYHPDYRFLRAAGVELDPATFAAVYDPQTMETTVPGLYVAGPVSAGVNCRAIFIENSRSHPALIMG